MSDNQVKEKELKDVVGGEGDIKPKYQVGFKYDSGLLGTGLPNHHITITVKGHLGVRNNEFYYSLEHVEEAYLCPKITTPLEKPESYLDSKKYDK